ncbi:septal ring lytic transglycosylase RlpA family protein [Erythrobacter sp.]|uniref:septal ring lytic transglycosylase RlpA family protein n=1 Tax=Erythrobacter sp. TaxID=1042 RepID=UPI003C73DE10
MLAPPASMAQSDIGPDETNDFDEAVFTPASQMEVDGADEAAFDPDAPFVTHFRPVVEPLGPDLSDLDLRVPDHAVDLEAFEPPLESTDVLKDLGAGVASYYGRRFHGRRTANGERFNMNALTAAHRTLPFGSKVRVINPRNGREVTVRINDRGPFTGGRVIDLSRAAAERIGLIKRGHVRVELELIGT